MDLLYIWMADNSNGHFKITVLPVPLSLWRSSTRLPQKREVNTILADIIKHLTPDRAFEDAYPQVLADRLANKMLSIKQVRRCGWDE